MIIAQQKRKENIAEYLLYMWQVEDLIRATGVSIEGVEEHLLPRYDVDEETRQAIRTWYQELIDMMRSEGKVKSGHLDVNRIVLMQLEELHRRLGAASADPPRPYPATHEGQPRGGERSRDLLQCALWLHHSQPPAEGGERRDKEVDEADQCPPSPSGPSLQDGARGHRPRDQSE